jgi:hypothetical protein
MGSSMRCRASDGEAASADAAAAAPGRRVGGGGAATTKEPADATSSSFCAPPSSRSSHEEDVDREATGAGFQKPDMVGGRAFHSAKYDSIRFMMNHHEPIVESAWARGTALIFV